MSTATAERVRAGAIVQYGLLAGPLLSMLASGLGLLLYGTAGSWSRGWPFAVCGAALLAWYGWHAVRGETPR